ncbi:MAG: DUF4178 domain-containing protein [Brachymonas sp.]|nr:DUF4178 domain-containing protein [Brachymonas sp.]
MATPPPLPSEGSARGKTQRVYQAACPSCGAPVRFFSASSTHAVCGYCKSTVVRDGDTLQRTGQMAEVFDDYSPLQLFATGHWPGEPAGKPLTFTVVGRLQYRYAEGSWNEWLLALDDGSTAFLSEDNGAYVLGRPLQDSASAQMQQVLLRAGDLQVNQHLALLGVDYTVTSVLQASLVAAEGELPRLPPLGRPFMMVELRSDSGTVLGAEWWQQGVAPQLSVGRSVRLQDLNLKGLRDDAAEKNVQGRQFACPNCGSPVQPLLPTTKSLTCGSCNSLINLDEGVGGELRHATQRLHINPTIALGATGILEGKSWQVVGFQHRVGQEEDDDETFGWSEYLLYNRLEGFLFLVESTDGWSLVRTTTGAPSVKGRIARHEGQDYLFQYEYEARTDYVAGEFYWQVEVGQTTYNREYRRGVYVLSREEGSSDSGREIVWSAGKDLPASTVADIFGLKSRAFVYTAGADSGSSLTLDTIVFWVVVIIVVLVLLSMCSDGGGGYVGGGSYGDYNSGGGHK